MTKKSYIVELLSDSAESRARIERLLSAYSHIQLTFFPLDALLTRAGEMRDADLILLDLTGDGARTDEAMVTQRKRLRGLPVVVVASDANPDLVRFIVRMEANDVVFAPIEPKKLMDAIDRNLGARDRIEDSHVTCFVSAVGGAGATSMAITAADLAAKQAKGKRDRVCLVDLDFAFGASGYYLDSSSDYDLSEIVNEPERIDAEFLDTLRKQKDAEGFAHFSFSKGNIVMHPQANDVILRMLEVITYQYNQIFIDMPYWNAPWREQVLQGVNDLFIVTSPMLPALKRSIDIYKEAAALRGGTDGMTIILNNYHRKMFSNTLAMSDLKKIFKERPFSVVRPDKETLTEAVNCAILPSEVRGRSGFVKDVTKVLAAHEKRKVREPEAA